MELFQIKYQEFPYVTIRQYVEHFVESLMTASPLPKIRRFKGIWKQYWGKHSYPNRFTQDELNYRTRLRKAFLIRLFRNGYSVIIEKEVNLNQAEQLIEEISNRRAKMHLSEASVAMAIEAVLCHRMLKDISNSNRLKLGVTYSAFGDIKKIARSYALELRYLFKSLFEVHLFAVARKYEALPEAAAIATVNVHLRNTTLEELIVCPGIKAPGLLGACNDAIRKDMDFVLSIDGDGRLPLFQILPALKQLIFSKKIDAVLGSRRVAGSVVSKPGIRYLTSFSNALFINTILQPVIGSVNDAQSIFKLYRGVRLRCALNRLGFIKTNPVLNDLVDSSLACELLLMSNLTEDGSLPNLSEVPAIESMAYPRDTRRMLIISRLNIKSMIAAASRLRNHIREKSIIVTGTESIVTQQKQNQVLKLPHSFERLSKSKLVPTSLLGENRILQASESLPEMLRSIIFMSAGRCHPDRGHGINPIILDLMKDRRPEINAILPAVKIVIPEHSIRMPLGHAVIVKWLSTYDKILANSGELLRKIGMRPMIEVQLIAYILRLFRFIYKPLRIFIQKGFKLLRRFISLLLNSFDRIASGLKSIFRWMNLFLETVKIMRVFVLIDKLDQRSSLFHKFCLLIVRVFLEIHWLLTDSFNVSMNLRRPVFCVQQSGAIRPVWTVIQSMPPVMTSEVKNVLDMALNTYQKLGDNYFYDNEISLDNIGFQILDSGPKVVLIDYGSIVKADRIPSNILRVWIQKAKADYENSYQAFKLRSYANGHPEMEEIVENYINSSLCLFDKWLNKTSIL